MRKKSCIPQLIISFLLCTFCVEAGDFKNEQMRYPRVREAFESKLDTIKFNFVQLQIDYPPEEAFIRIFKQEDVLELWAKSSDTDTFQLVKSYRVAAKSGQLGPKRRRGDMQVPEGFYHIDRFNPCSDFHLSVGINYPNDSDRILGYKPSLGGDIFIHGSSVTIGCVPITDDCIKELYIILVDVRDNGQNRIPVHIFPFKMTAGNMKEAGTSFFEVGKFLKFWENLKVGYEYFEKRRKLPRISVNESGKYKFR